MRDVLERCHDRGFALRPRPDLAGQFRPPDRLRDAAEGERSYLATQRAGTTVLDPHELLATWTDLRFPAWYDEAARSEADIAELDHPEALTTMLWRARQELRALRRTAARHQP